MATINFELHQNRGENTGVAATAWAALAANHLTPGAQHQTRPKGSGTAENAHLLLLDVWPVFGLLQQAADCRFVARLRVP
jgi:hypothetical protein